MAFHGKHRAAHRIMGHDAPTSVTGGVPMREFHDEQWHAKTGNQHALRRMGRTRICSCGFHIPPTVIVSRGTPSPDTARTHSSSPARASMDRPPLREAPDGTRGGGGRLSAAPQLQKSHFARTGGIHRVVHIGGQPQKAALTWNLMTGGRPHRGQPCGPRHTDMTSSADSSPSRGGLTAPHLLRALRPNAQQQGDSPQRAPLSSTQQ